MKLLVKNDFKTFKGEKSEKPQPNHLSLEQISNKTNLNTETVFLIIRKLEAFGFIQWSSSHGHFTVWRFGLTSEGYLQYTRGLRNALKKFSEKLLIGLAATSPIVTIFIYYISINSTNT